VITSSERKALLFLAAVIALGTGVRVVNARQPPPNAADSAGLALQLSRVDAARAGKGARKARAPARKARAAAITAGESPIDLDVAAAGQIERLTGIGEVTAARIVANRDTFGPFGSIEGLTRVKGVGPALSERIRPYVTFSGVARPTNAVVSPGRALQERRRAPRATRLPGN
jgi:competence protein ComEA